MNNVSLLQANNCCPHSSLRVRSPPCRNFTPKLISFYEKVGRSNKVQVVFVSSDKDEASFKEYFAKMPWAAMPENSADAKKRLASTMKVQGIPSLVVLDVKTGNFVTDNARNQVDSAGDDIEKGRELIASWRAKEKIALQLAPFGVEGQSTGGFTILQKLLRNPMYLFGLFYIVRQIIAKLKTFGNSDSHEL